MNRSRVIIAGSRDCPLEDRGLYEAVRAMLFTETADQDIEIVSGGARGADKFGERFATEHSLPLKVCKANWDKYGKRAGYLRNIEMAELDDVRELIILWDGVSKGSKHMIDIALARCIKTTVIFYEEL